MQIRGATKFKFAMPPKRKTLEEEEETAAKRSKVDGESGVKVEAKAVASGGGSSSASSSSVVVNSIIETGSLLGVTYYETGKGTKRDGGRMSGAEAEAVATATKSSSSSASSSSAIVNSIVGCSGLRFGGGVRLGSSGNTIRSKGPVSISSVHGKSGSSTSIKVGGDLNNSGVISMQSSNAQATGGRVRTIHSEDSKGTKRGDVFCDNTIHSDGSISVTSVHDKNGETTSIRTTGERVRVVDGRGNTFSGRNLQIHNQVSVGEVRCVQRAGSGMPPVVSSAKVSIRSVPPVATSALPVVNKAKGSTGKRVNPKGSTFFSESSSSEESESESSSESSSESDDEEVPRRKNVSKNSIGKVHGGTHSFRFGAGGKSSFTSKSVIDGDGEAVVINGCVHIRPKTTDPDPQVKQTTFTITDGKRTCIKDYGGGCLVEEPVPDGPIASMVSTGDITNDFTD